MNPRAPSPEIVLVVDDDPGNLDSVQRILQREGLEVLAAASGEEALEILRKSEVRVIVTDLMMPGMTGTALLRAAKAISPHVEVVLMTAYGTVEAAVEAMKEGADDFLTKPLKRHQLVRTVKKALEKYRLLEENRLLREKVAQLSKVGGLVGSSPAFRAVMDTIRQAAPSNATILLLGESGTGKELVARAIHELSPRHAASFVPIDCASIPESLLESELFGHEAGAFTGATRRKEGRFERADGGTLFLDEVAELSAEAQAKLLRALESGEVERVGGQEPIRVDVRVIAATNRNLRDEIAAGRFREDVYYRLNVIPIHLPPLRERAEDIPELAAHFLARLQARHGLVPPVLRADAIERLVRYRWPGNVRELANVCERLAILHPGGEVGAREVAAMLPDGGAAGTPADAAGGTAAGAAASATMRTMPGPGGDGSLSERLDAYERALILAALEEADGNVADAARRLGTDRANLYRRMRRLEIER